MARFKEFENVSLTDCSINEFDMEQAYAEGSYNCPHVNIELTISGIEAKMDFYEENDYDMLSDITVDTDVESYKNAIVDFIKSNEDELAAAITKDDLYKETIKDYTNVCLETEKRLEKEAKENKYDVLER